MQSCQLKLNRIWNTVVFHIHLIYFNTDAKKESVLATCLQISPIWQENLFLQVTFIAPSVNLVTVFILMQKVKSMRRFFTIEDQAKQLWSINKTGWQQTVQKEKVWLEGWKFLLKFKTTSSIIIVRKRIPSQIFLLTSYGVKVTAKTSLWQEINWHIGEKRHAEMAYNFKYTKIAWPTLFSVPARINKGYPAE